jgi:phosphoribosyl 1,2-cyclic phosphodiesterase
MDLRVWGARGSVPAPGPHTNRYGGNTSCVQVTLSDGSLLVLDAGSGIRALGLRLAAADAPRIDILLTHLHVDHIQGLMFFAPLFAPVAEIVLWGPREGAGLAERLARYLSPPLSPLHLRDLPGRVSFREVPEGEWEIGPARVQAAQARHPGVTLGYRIAEGDRSVCSSPTRSSRSERGRVPEPVRSPPTTWLEAPRSSCTTASTRTRSTPPTSAGGIRGSATCSPSLA